MNALTTALTNQEQVVYTAEQVEQIVEMLIHKLSQQALVPISTHLENGITQQTLSGTKMTLSVSEVAEKLGISKPKVYDLIHEGDLPSIHVGKKIVIPTEALIGWLSGGVSNGKETCQW